MLQKKISAAVSLQPLQSLDTVYSFQQKVTVKPNSHTRPSAFTSGADPSQRSPCECLCLHHNMSQHVSLQLCVWFCVCLCFALTGETAAAGWVSDWSPVARSGELCELWCSLTTAFSWKASLWGPAGFQCAHLHIKTAQERDSAQEGWGTAEGGRAG